MKVPKVTDVYGFNTGDCDKFKCVAWCANLYGCINAQKEQCKLFEDKCDDLNCDFAGRTSLAVVVAVLLLWII